MIEQAAAVLCCKDWIGYKLTGAYQVDPTEASVMPGDARTRGYSDAMLRLFGLEACRHLFPVVRPSEAIAGESMPKLMHRLDCRWAFRWWWVPATSLPLPLGWVRWNRASPARCWAPISSIAWSRRRRSLSRQTWGCSSVFPAALGCVQPQMYPERRAWIGLSPSSARPRSMPQLRKRISFCDSRQWRRVVQLGLTVFSIYPI